MKPIHFTLFLIFLITFSSCKKEKRIEKNLWKKGGHWNVEYLLLEKPSTDEVFFNCGVYTFKKDGTGKSILTTNTDVIIQDFDYSLLPSGYDGYKLTLISNDSDTAEYEVDWVKHKIELRKSKNDIDETMYLSKDN